MKKYLIFLYWGLVALFYFAVWNIGNNDPVNSFHSLVFLMSSVGIPFIIVMAIMATLNVVAVIGTVQDKFEVVMEKWIWTGAIVVTFIVAGIFAFNRAQCGDDINVKFRYTEFISAKGWTN